MLFSLPDGFKTELGTIFDKVKIGELTGKQQNYLMDIKSLQLGLHHINKILEDLVQGFYSQDGAQYQGTVKSALSKISLTDVETILIKIRENTFGPIFLLKGKCTHCDAQNDMKLDLSTLNTVSSKPEDKDRIVEVTLPRSNKKAQLKLLGLSSIEKSYQIFQKNQSELITATAALALKSLDGKESPTSEDVMTLPVLDISYINEEYKKLGGKVDTTITHQCKSCSKDFDIILNVVDPSFFTLT